MASSSPSPSPAALALYQVELSHQISSLDEAMRSEGQTHFIRITAAPLQPGDDVAIFVHQVEVLNPQGVNGPEQLASFTNVVTAADYNELPAAPPSEANQYLLYRSTTIEHYGRSAVELNDLWTSVVDRTQSLIAGFKRARELTDGPSIQIT